MSDRSTFFGAAFGAVVTTAIGAGATALSGSLLPLIITNAVLLLIIGWQYYAYKAAISAVDDLKYLKARVQDIWFDTARVVKREDGTLEITEVTGVIPLMRGGVPDMSAEYVQNPLPVRR